MAIEKEPSSYEKTVLSELHGAWQNLRDEVAEHAGFPDWQRALFHIDEAMSWESVRNLQTMHKCLILVRNLLGQDAVPAIVGEYLEEVNDLITMGVIPRSLLRPIRLLQWKYMISEQLHLIPRLLAAG